MQPFAAGHTDRTLGKLVAVFAAIACLAFGLWLNFESFIPGLPSNEYWGDTIIGGAFDTLGVMILGFLVAAPALRSAIAARSTEATTRQKRTGRHPEG